MLPKDQKGEAITMSDTTKISSTTWGKLKSYAMQDNYRTTTWFLNLSGEDKEKLQQLKAA